MDASQEMALRTLLLLLMIFFIILDCGLANEDELQDLSWELENPKAMVAMIPDGKLRKGRDVSNPYDCFPDEYYSDFYRRCIGCTRCSPGTQHDPRMPCGHGQGQEAHCTSCEDGYYQSKEGLPILTCQPCLICDPRATVKRACTQRSDTVCGKCQKGWYYREKNACEECTEADMVDSTNKDCYQEPDPTPGSKPTPEPGPSTTVPVQNTDETSSEHAVMHTSGKIVKPRPQNGLDPLFIGLIVVAALCVALAICIILYRSKNKKENGGHPPAQNDYEMDPLKGQDDQKQNHQRSGSCHSDEANRCMGELVPPSSHRNSSQNESDSSNNHSEDQTHYPDEVPARNYVTRDNDLPPDTYPLYSSITGPLSDFKSLKSFRVEAEGASFQVPDMFEEGIRSPTERFDPNSQVSNKEDPVGNYDVAKDASCPSGFYSLSSSLQHNI